MFLQSTSKMFCGLFAVFAVIAFQPYLAERIVSMCQWHFLIWWIACWALPGVLSWLSWKAGESRGASMNVLGMSAAGCVLYAFSLFASPASRLYTGWDVLVPALIGTPINIAGAVICIAAMVASASALSRKDYLIYPPAYPMQVQYQQANAFMSPQAPQPQDQPSRAGIPSAPMPSQYSLYPVASQDAPRKGFVATVWKPALVAVIIVIVAPVATFVSCQVSNQVQSAVEEQQSEVSWKASNPKEASYLEARGLEPYLHFYFGNSTPYLLSDYKDGVGAVSWTFGFDSTGRMYAYSGDFSGLKFQEMGCTKWSGTAFTSHVVFELSSFDDEILSGLDRNDMKELMGMDAGVYGDSELAEYLD